jgi:hypothetical protein
MVGANLLCSVGRHDGSPLGTDWPRTGWRHDCPCPGPRISGRNRHDGDGFQCPIKPLCMHCGICPGLYDLDHSLLFRSHLLESRMDHLVRLCHLLHLGLRLHCRRHADRSTSSCSPNRRLRPRLGPHRIPDLRCWDDQRDEHLCQHMWLVDVPARHLRNATTPRLPQSLSAGWIYCRRNVSLVQPGDISLVRNLALGACFWECGSSVQEDILRNRAARACDRSRNLPTCRGKVRFRTLAPELRAPAVKQSHSLVHLDRYQRRLGRGRFHRCRSRADPELPARSGRCPLLRAVQLDLPRTSLDARLQKVQIWIDEAEGQVRNAHAACSTRALHGCRWNVSSVAVVLEGWAELTMMFSRYAAAASIKDAFENGDIARVFDCADNSGSDQ